MSTHVEILQRSSTARKIWRLLPRQRRRSAIQLWLLMVIGMAFEMLGIGLIIPVVALFGQQDLSTKFPVVQSILSGLGYPDQKTIMIAAMLILASVYVVKNSYLAFLAWTQTRFAYGLQAEISHRLFELYLRQPYTFHLQRNSAQLIRNVQGEVGVFINSAVNPAMMLLTEGLVLIGICMLLLVVEPIGTLLIVLVLGLAAWAFQRATKVYVRRWGKARQFHEGLRLQHLSQGLGGAKDVKILGRESDFLNQFGFHTTESTKMFQRQATLQQMPRLWLELLGVAGLVVLVISMLSQDKDLSSILPTLGLFAAAAFRLMPSMNRMISAGQQLRFAHSTIGTLFDELSLTEESDIFANKKRKKQFLECIELTDVCFTYAGASKPALSGITLTIQKGESVGFIGPSGSGKSTIVDVLLGLLPVDGGCIMVDRQEMYNDLRWWQDQIGYVPQSIYLTDDTLRRNIAFGLNENEINNEAVRKAINAAQLDEFVEGLTAGIDTIVGERGVRLSGGQRQRIGIARALYHDPSVLVLDEATSSLDVHTEERIMEAVIALSGTKTIIIVAHRLSTVEHCDRLYRLEQGKIVDSGPPEQLISLGRPATRPRS